MAKGTCGVPDCEDAIRAMGLCDRHYQRKRNHGSAGYKPPTTEERFWAKVDKNGPIPNHRPDLGPCWTWTASTIGKTGYGWFGYGGRNGVRTPAHRYAYTVSVGPIPDGLHIDHLCRVRLCVRPDHLEAVTQQENNRRAAAVKPKVTHCPQGHEYTAENTRRHPDGAPECRTCMRARWAAKAALRPPKPPRTHCKHGHPLTPENVYTKPSGYRDCRTCRRSQFARWAEKNRGVSHAGRDPRTGSSG